MRAQSKRVSLSTGTAKKKPDHALRVLFFEDPDGRWAAQCLEYDIAAQAPRLEELYYEMERVLVSHIALADELGHEPFAGIPKAPKRYWDIFKKASLRVDRPESRQKPRDRTEVKVKTEVKVAPRQIAA